MPTAAHARSNCPPTASRKPHCKFCGTRHAAPAKRKAATLRERVMVAVLASGASGMRPFAVAYQIAADLKDVEFYLGMAMHQGFVEPCQDDSPWPCMGTKRGRIEFGDLIA